MSSRYISRWVDERAARSYLRHDAMIGRVRHCLPKELTGLDKLYRKRGLSFGLTRRGWWNAHGDTGVCFILDRTRIANPIIEIAGHPVFVFSDFYGLPPTLRYADQLAALKEAAICESQANPDEAFILGDLRDLHDHIVDIRVGSKIGPRLRTQISEYRSAYDLPASLQDTCESIAA